MIIKIKYNNEVLTLISICRIPSSFSDGPYFLLVQYNEIDRKAKPELSIEKEIMQQIRKCVSDNRNISNMVVAREFN